MTHFDESRTVYLVQFRTGNLVNKAKIHMNLTVLEKGDKPKVLEDMV